MAGLENLVLCIVVLVLGIGIAIQSYKLGFKRGREKTIFEVRKDFVLMNNRLEEARMKVYHLEEPETERPAGNRPYLKPEDVDSMIDSVKESTTYHGQAFDKDDKPAGWGNV